MHRLSIAALAAALALLPALARGDSDQLGSGKLPLASYEGLFREHLAPKVKLGFGELVPAAKRGTRAQRQAQREQALALLQRQVAAYGRLYRGSPLLNWKWTAPAQPHFVDAALKKLAMMPSLSAGFAASHGAVVAYPQIVGTKGQHSISLTLTPNPSVEIVHSDGVVDSTGIFRRYLGPGQSGPPEVTAERLWENLPHVAFKGLRKRLRGQGDLPERKLPRVGDRVQHVTHLAQAGHPQAVAGQILSQSVQVIGKADVEVSKATRDTDAMRNGPITQRAKAHPAERVSNFAGKTYASGWTTITPRPLRPTPRRPRR